MEEQKTGAWLEELHLHFSVQMLTVPSSLNYALGNQTNFNKKHRLDFGPTNAFTMVSNCFKLSHKTNVLKKDTSNSDKCQYGGRYILKTVCLFKCN